MAACTDFSVSPPCLWSLTGWPCSWYCRQCNAWCCRGSNAGNLFVGSGTSFLTDVPTVRTMTRLLSARFFPLQVWRVLCGARLSHRWIQGLGPPPSQPSPPGCLRHLHVVNPLARLFTKAKRKAFFFSFPIQSQVALTVRICSISKSSPRRLDGQASFPSTKIPPCIFAEAE